MEIRATTPINRTSFGMAFKTPSADKMQNFLDYVGAGVSGKDAKKALQALIKQQEKNQHFDIEYKLDNVVAIVPKSQKAREIYGTGERLYIPKNYKFSDGLEKVRARIENLKEKNGGKLTRLQRICLGIMYMPKILMASIKEAKDPFQFLPDNLRYAAEIANCSEKNVEAIIAKENLIKSAFGAK